MQLYENLPAGTVDRARAMRKTATPPERALWAGLRRAFPNLRFRRQAPIGPYFADFLSVGAKLVIEVDGDTHAGAKAYDVRRSAFISCATYRVLRFTNAEVLGNLDGVLTQISFSLREKDGAPQARKDEGDLIMEKGEAA